MWLSERLLGFNPILPWPRGGYRVNEHWQRACRIWQENSPYREPLSRLIAIAACLTIGAFGLPSALSALAAETDRFSSATLEFHIPEQPLASALQAFSSISGVAVLYASGVETGQRSAPLDGEYTREAALKVLLSGSGLVPRYARSDAIALVDPTAPSPYEPPDNVLPNADMALDTLHVTGAAKAPDRDALSDYIGIIQQDIQKALKKAGATREGSYRVGVDLWVDSSRIIRRTEVFRSTGSQERDVAVGSVLQGMVIRQPAPANTPQPVRVMIVVRSM